MILSTTHGSTVRTRRWARLVRPRTPGQLHAYIRAVLGFNIPQRPLVAGHDAPFDYVQHAFFEDRQPRDCAVWANRGGGKTQLGAIVTLLDLLFKPGIQVRILGGSFEQSSKMYRYLKQLLERDELIDLVSGSVTGRAVELTNGSRVEVLSQSERAVRGQRVHKLRCDEVELFEPDVWEAAQMVTRSGRCGDTFVRGSIETLSTMHRPFGLMQKLVRESTIASRRVFRWSMLDVLERCEPERKCETCPLWDACQGRAKQARGFLRIDDAIQQQLRVGAHTWASEMLCEQPSRAETVFPEFDEKVHVREFEISDPGSPDPRTSNLRFPNRRIAGGGFASSAVGRPLWLGGIDFGYRSLSVLLWAVLDESDVLHVMDELAMSETLVEQMIAEASRRPWPRPLWIGADPAGRQRSDQTGLSTIHLWKQAGWPIRSFGSQIEPGVAAVRRRLRRADGAVCLRIHPRCRTLIRSLSMYHYPVQRPESLDPVKDGNDHACDALRYLVANLDRAGSNVEVTKY